MLHHELFSSTEDDPSILEMMNRLREYEEAKCNISITDTDKIDKLLVHYISDMVMSAYVDLILSIAPKNEKEALDKDNPDREKWIDVIQK
jgi:hypothetical protein